MITYEFLDGTIEPYKIPDASVIPKIGESIVYRGYKFYVIEVIHFIEHGNIRIILNSK